MLHRIVIGTFATLFVVVVGTVQADEPRDYSGYSVVQAVVDSTDQLAQIEKIAESIWSDYRGVGTLDVMVSPEQLAKLESAGISYKMWIPDVQALIDLERVPAGRGTWDAYMDFADIVTFINDLETARPDLCEVTSIGTSIEGRDIWMLHIAGTPSGSKPGVLYHSLIHCREWITGPVILYLADHLINNYDTDPDVKTLVDGLDIYLVPVVNPDGYVYTWTSDRMWRKNRRNNGTGYWGVDLNRNFGYMWGYDDSGSSPYTWDDTYRGTGPFSEPETQALRDFVTVRPNLQAYMDNHSYSQLILWPWGYACLGGPSEPDATTFSTLGNSMQSLIQSVHGKYFEPGPICETIYPANGGSVDWAYGDEDLIGYTIELRDTGTHGFLLPADQILPSCEEYLPAILHLTEWALSQVGTTISFPNGLPNIIAPATPEVIDVEVSPLGETVVSNSPTLYYRYDAGAFLTETMSHVSGDLYQATLPAASCADTPQYYFSAEGSSSGVVYEPSGAPAEYYTVGVGELETVLADDFETNQGWVAENLGASSGDWQRGVPVNDPGWDYDPASDSDGSGQCYLTQNQTGNTDVDGGAVRLTSPTIDMSGGDVTISYDYYLYLTDSDGTDRLLVEINNNGGVGTWIEIARHDTNGGLNWRSHTIDQDDLDTAGVTLTADMKIRLTANDGNSQSIVEAGLDAFEVASLTCTDAGCPSPGVSGFYCATDVYPNNGDGTWNYADDGDCIIDMSDLGELLPNYGTTSGMTREDGDVYPVPDGDGAVDMSDLGELLAQYGDNCN